MLRDSDFCRNLRATLIGTWSGITERRMCRQETGERVQGKPICLLANLISDGLRLWLYPCTLPVNSECVCRFRRLWFHWLRAGSNFLLKEEKKGDKEHLQGTWDTYKQEGTVSASCTLIGSTCIISLHLGDFACTPGMQKMIPFDVGRAHINLNWYLFFSKKKKKKAIFILH